MFDVFTSFNTSYVIVKFPYNFDFISAIIFSEICKRERCPVSFVGEVTGDGYMSLVEESYSDKVIGRDARLKPEMKSKLPFDLHLEAVLGKLNPFTAIPWPGPAEGACRDSQKCVGGIVLFPDVKSI